MVLGQLGRLKLRYDSNKEHVNFNVKFRALESAWCCPKNEIFLEGARKKSTPKKSTVGGEPK
jgi:hypothetical protein